MQKLLTFIPKVAKFQKISLSQQLLFKNLTSRLTFGVSTVNNTGEQIREQQSKRNQSQQNYRRNQQNYYEDKEENVFNSQDQVQMEQNLFEQEIEPINFSQEKLPNFKKVFYNPLQISQEDPEVVKAHMTENQINIISAKKTPPPAFTTWQNCPLQPQITEFLEKQGFTKPTAVQSQCIPTLLNGSDLIGISQTGSGKTLSYLLPMMTHLKGQEYNNRRIRQSPQGLVLVPTRELANQVQSESFKYSQAFKLYSTAIYGGARKSQQEQQLARKPEILIATPGRLLDFLISRTIDLRSVTYLVLDEADRMLDMGFEPQIRKVMGQIRPDRQIAMFSATWPNEIKQLAMEFCRNDTVHIQIGEKELNVNLDIEQKIEIINYNSRFNRLLEIIKENQDQKILIFTQTKQQSDDLQQNLMQEQIQAQSLHGDKNQSQRDSIMRGFKSGYCKILIATDVASRGLDVKDVKLVINYQLPQNIESYVHRIGRTGRAGAQGKSISFFDQKYDMPIAKTLIQLLRDHHQQSQELEDFYQQNNQCDEFAKQQNQSSHQSINEKNSINHSRKSIILNTNSNLNITRNSLVLPPDIQIKNPQENANQHLSYIRKIPPLTNLETCKLKNSKEPVDFLSPNLEQNQELIKKNEPSDEWTLLKEIPQDHPALQTLKQCQIKYGYLTLNQKKKGQIRLPAYENKKGQIYEGEWKDKQRHGKGILYMKDGSVYEGKWRNDQINKIGRLANQDGNVYEGEFQNGQANGKGVFYYANGSQYIGFWKNDHYEGKGRKTWSNKSIYDGDFVNGQRHGHGVFKWQNGSFYCGQFENNQINGKGYFQWINGRLFEGEWKNGKINGKGKEYFGNGQTYEGEYVDDKKEGYGVYQFNENKQYIGQWKNDYPNGDGVLVENGVSQQGVWEDGKHIKWVEIK